MKQFETDICKQTLSLNDKLLSIENYQNEITLYHNSSNQIYLNVLDFLKEWYNDTPTINLQTSGSTGTPKVITVLKSQMINSAIMTLQFLDLKPYDKALLCLPTKYIAGKMMIVRSLVGKLDLVSIKPSSHPLANIDNNTIFDFVAMTPMQVYETLKSEKERLLFQHIKKVIIGGGSIDKQVEKLLFYYPNQIWSTYGMTETLSHIAMRRISGYNSSPYYETLNGIDISKDINNCLVINAPFLNIQKLVTNDIVRLKGYNKFLVIGRKDNTINTGGIKVQIEEIETELEPYLYNISYCVTSIPDSKLGEQIILLIETKDKIYLTKVEEAIKHITKYHQPKKIIFIDEIPYTPTGKIDRYKAKNLMVNN